MAQTKNGDTVRVHYTGKLDDGSVFDTSAGRAPLEFTLGEGRVIPGFEHAVLGMNQGESVTTKISAADAYGTHSAELVLVVDREQFPADTDPKVGDQFQVSQPSGRTVVVRVTAISDGKVTLDGNHPLAGQDLTFEIKLVEIV